MARPEASNAVKLQPVHVTREGVDVFWQIPDQPKAVLFIVHAGSGNPGTYWDHQPSRHSPYVALKEHTRIVQHALSRSYAVIAIKSTKEFWQDWPPEASQDALNVKSILQGWLSEHHELQDLPLTALGAASGGNFVSVLALSVRFSAIVLMVSQGTARAFDMCNSDYPPTLFIHMPKDSITFKKVAQHFDTLQSKGVPAKKIVCSRFPIYPQDLKDHAPGLDFESAAKIYVQMISDGVLNMQGFVIDPLRPPRVRNLLEALDISPCTENDEINASLMRAWEENLSNLLRVAEGRHAVTSRHCDEMFKWLDEKN